MNNVNRNCAYAPMAQYNTSGDIRVPVPVTANQGFYVVPDYQTFGYQTLTGARSGVGPSCSGYFSLDHAYGSCNSMSFVRRSCM